MAKKKQQETYYDVQPLRTQKEIDDFKWALRRFGSERDVFLFTLGINCGLRVSDLLPMKVGDVRAMTHNTVIEQKTGKKRTITLKKLQGEIDDYTKGMADDDYLFPSRTPAEGRGYISETQAYRVLVKAAEALGRKDIGTHTMRKTFGYHHYKHNKDVAVLQKIFNHSSPSITKSYIGIEQDEIDASLEGFKL